MFLSYLHVVSSSESSSSSFFLNIGGRAGPIKAFDSIIKPKNLITLRSIVKKLHHKQEEPGRKTTFHPGNTYAHQIDDRQTKMGIWL